jgi:hypothetical protein
MKATLPAISCLGGGTSGPSLGDAFGAASGSAAARVATWLPAPVFPFSPADMRLLFVSRGAAPRLPPDRAASSFRQAADLEAPFKTETLLQRANPIGGAGALQTGRRDADPVLQCRLHRRALVHG